MAEAAYNTAGAGWQANYPMERISSWRAGGAAKWLFTAPPGWQADSEAMLTLPYTLPPSVCGQAGSEEMIVIGYGSNLLVRDGGYDGIIIRSAPGLTQLRQNEDGSITAGAGVGCPKLARFCAERNLDAAFFAGIPGTVGGALAMNAGCYGGETWQQVQSVDVMEAAGVRSYCPSAFDISYRSAKHRHKTSVYFAAARFCFAALPANEANDKIKTLLQQRRAAQPLGNACAGSVFCNPPNDYAGRLIEQCGLKNHRIGGAVVSDKHANFIVNDNNASAYDIEALMLYVQETVEAKTGTRLQPEVRIIGRAA